ncbi:MAG: hypothetical protein FH756_05980 [Firmicutes bacterium]|nr:hypothetical protein [Bacillota bacterium]
MGDNEKLLEHEVEVITSILQSKAKYRQIIQAGIAQWVKDFQSGRIKIETVDDLRKLVELDIKLQKDELD